MTDQLSTLLIILILLVLIFIFAWVSYYRDPARVTQRAVRRAERQHAAIEEARRIRERRIARIENIKSGVALSWFAFSTIGVGAAIVIVSIIAIGIVMSVEYRCIGSV